MQENVTPALTTGAPGGSLADLPHRNAERAPERVAFSKPTDDGGWTDVTTTQFRDTVDAVARGFVAAGIQPGDRIAIMSKTRYEWTVVDFAAWTAGAVVVPVYETSSAEQVQWIVEDSGAVAIVVETPGHLAVVESVRDALPTLAHVWQLDAGDLETLAASGAGIGDAELDARRDALGRDSIATIIYTSGTTGRPKGCELTHDNFLGLAENTVSRLGDVVSAEGASTLLFLPLAHVFARFIEVLAVVGEARMGHSSNLANILDDFGAFRPTFILAVPRVFEKIYNKAQEQAHASSSAKGKIFDAAAATAIAWSEAVDTGRVPFALKARHALYDKLVYSKIRTKMGGQTRYAVSGGAPLGTRLGHFFRGIGVTILEGYGLTETTAPITVNVPDRVKIGTVGLPLPGCGVRIAEDGEVLAQGVNIFTGYRNNEKATAEAIRDGWFHTGDIGELDEDGYLTITGRKKEILVTAGGKNVAPAVLEDRLRAHPLVSQCMVVGDQRPFIAALVTLDPEMLPGWAANNGLEGISIEDARTNEKVLGAIQDAVDDANNAVSKAESIRKFIVLEGDFTEDSGHLTPSLKLKRSVVMRDYANAIEDIYG